MKPTGLPKTARLLVALVAALLAVVAGVASSARATPPPWTPTATAHLIAGSPSITQPTSNITFPNTTLDGASVDYTKDSASGDQLAVLNPGGSTGWTVTAAATAFTCIDTTCGSATTPDTFTGLSITNASSSSWSDTAAVTPACSGSCIPATNTTDTTVGWGAPLSTSATQLYDADANSGVGALTFPTAWWIAVPNNVREGHYTSTVTLDITADGP